MPAPIPAHRPLANRFRGRVAIVTGGAGGIGRAIVEELCKEGCRVAFGDLSPERGAASAAADRAAGHETLFVAGDMGRGQSLIVWAIAEGRAAAAGVDRHLMGHTALPAPIPPTAAPQR